MSRQKWLPSCEEWTVSELISIWRQHAKGEQFGEFLLLVCAIDNEVRDDDERLSACVTLEMADHTTLVRWARERFGLEE